MKTIDERVRGVVRSAPIAIDSQTKDIIKSALTELAREVREADAKLCDAIAVKWNMKRRDNYGHAREITADECAAAIRTAKVGE